MTKAGSVSRLLLYPWFLYPYPSKAAKAFIAFIKEYPS